jgi:hypothetical protein
MMDFINSTLGIIVSIVTLVSLCAGGGYMVYRRMTKVKYNKGNIQEGKGNNIISGTSNVTIVGDNNVVQASPNSQKIKAAKEKVQKDLTQILFIDDEDFSVLKMLKRAGWKNVKKKSDICDLDDVDVRNADIIFVDIKGVGMSLGFKNQGAGLAAAIKQRYPNKGVVIYSGTHEHDIFDLALDQVNARLPKNAEPVQFMYLIEQYGRKED